MFVSNPESYPKWSETLRRLYVFVMIAPFLSAIFWAVETVYLLAPYYEEIGMPLLTGSALFVGCTSGILLTYGFFHWRSESWRLTVVSQSCGAIVILLLFLLQLVFNSFVLDEYKSNYVVFITYSLLPLFHNAYRHHWIGPSLTFEDFLKLKPQDDERRQAHAEMAYLIRRRMAWGYVVSVLFLIFFGLSVHYSFHDSFGWQIFLSILYADFALIFHSFTGFVTSPVVINLLYVSGRLVLFFCDKEYWSVGVAINYAMFTWILVYHSINRRHPLKNREDALNEVLGGLERAVVLEYQTQQWLKGRPGAKEQLLQRSHLAHVPGFKQGIAAGLAVEDHVFHLVERYSFLLTPEFGALFLTVIFIVYVVVAYYAGMNQIWTHLFPRVNLPGSWHDSYEFGLFALVLVAISGLWLYAFRVYTLARYKFTLQTIVSVLAFLTVAEVFGYVLYYFTWSNFLFVFGFYLPPIAVLAAYLYLQWSARDYYWNSWLKNQQRAFDIKYQNRMKELRKMERENRRCNLPGTHSFSDASFVIARPGAASVSAGPRTVNSPKAPKSQLRSPHSDVIQDFESPLSLTSQKSDQPPKQKVMIPGGFVFSDGTPESEMREMKRTQHEFRPHLSIHWVVSWCRSFFTLQQEPMDYVLLLVFLAIGLLVMGIGFTLAEIETRDGSYLVAAVVGLIITSIFFLLKWVNTFDIGSLLVVVIVSLCVYCAYLLQFSEQFHMTGLALLMILGYPATLGFMMAFWSWKAQNWVVSKREFMVMGGSSALGLIFWIIFVILVGDIIFGIIVIFICLLLIFFLGLGMYWSYCQFYLPLKWKIIASIILGSIFLVAAILLGISGASWFAIITVIWIFVMIVLLAISVEGLYERNDKKLFPSSYIFPVYRFEPELQDQFSLVPAVTGYSSLCLAAVLTMMWGFTAALLLPHGYIGWIAVSAASLTLWSALLHSRYTGIREFWLAFNVIEEHPDLIDNLRQAAIQKQYRTDDSSLCFDVSARGESADDEFKASAQDYLRSIRMYWQWEERAQIDNLLLKRREFVLTTRPSVYASRAGMREFADRAMELDKEIATAYDTQNKTLLTFSLLTILRAKTLQEQNRIVIRDFINTKLASEDLSKKTLADLSEWVQEKKETLKELKQQYIQSMANAKSKDRELMKMEQKMKNRRVQMDNYAEEIATEGTDVYNYRRKKLPVAFELNDIRGPNLEEVRERARKRLEEINRVLEELKEPFCDIDFPPIKDLDGLIQQGERPVFDQKDSKSLVAGSENEINSQWERPHEFLEGYPPPTVFLDGADASDIVQGDLEDCYLLAAMSVVALDEERARRLFISDKHNPNGVYAMVFFVDGEWRAVFIDDQFPVKLSAKRREGNDSERGTPLAFASCFSPNELWVPILEKCYAKLYGGYPSIIFGLVHESFKDLTGGAADEIRTDKAKSSSLWLTLLTYNRDGYLMGCGNPAKRSGQFFEKNSNGIVQGHAYAILDVREVDEHKLLKLRNPWGESTWNGDWSEGSLQMTQRMQSLLNYSTQTDGTFWMSFADFQYQFQRIYVCRIFDPRHVIDLDKKQLELSSTEESRGVPGYKRPRTSNADLVELLVERKRRDVTPLETGKPREIGHDFVPWYKRRVESAWKGITAAGCPSPRFLQAGSKPENNPQFVIWTDAIRPVIVFITLSQPFKAKSSDYILFNFYVLHKDTREEPIRVFGESDAAHPFKPFRQEREISLEVTLKPNQVYTIFPTTFEPGKESPFVITCYSRSEFMLRSAVSGVGRSFLAQSEELEEEKEQDSHV